jgi:capsular polysaccharide biosynthesis protein
MTLTEPQQREARRYLPEQPGSSRGTWAPQRRGALLATIAILAGLVVGFLTSALVQAKTPVYRSSAVLLMDQPGAISLSQGDGVVLKLSRLRLKYVGIVGTEVINQPVSKQLRLRADRLGGVVTATAPGDNLNIVITSQTTTKARAVPLAAATATQLQHYLDNEQTLARIASNVRLHLTLVQPASAAAESGNGDHRRAVVGIAAGVLAAAAVAALGLLRR